jgi:hypothetical protein
VVFFRSVSAPLYARRSGAGGEWLDVSLMQFAAALPSSKIVEAYIEDDGPLNTPGGSFRTLDGWIAIAQQSAHSCDPSPGHGPPRLRQNPALQISRQAEGLDIVEVHYKSTVRAMTDVLGAQIALYPKSGLRDNVQ